MHRNKPKVSFSGLMATVFVMIAVILLKESFLSGEKVYWSFIIAVPLVIIAIANHPFRKRRNKRNQRTQWKPDMSVNYFSHPNNLKWKK